MVIATSSILRPFLPAYRADEAKPAWPGKIVWIVTSAFLACHALLPHLFPWHASLLSLGFLVLAPLMAGASCLRRDLAGGVQGRRLLTVAMLLWGGGMAANVLGAVSGESGISMLLFVLYGVPIIFAIASPQEEACPVRLVDAMLAVALGLLFSSIPLPMLP